jgi:hypothetical protein
MVMEKRSLQKEPYDMTNLEPSQYRAPSIALKLSPAFEVMPVEPRSFQVSRFVLVATPMAEFCPPKEETV